MDNENHYINIREYIIASLRIWCERVGHVAFIGSNSFVYYGPRKKHDVVGPDMYVVNGGVHRGQEKWIALLEGGLLPTLAMEFLSDSTREYDRTEKFAIYRDRVKCEDLFHIDEGPTIRAWHLREGEYIPVLPDARGHFACASLPLRVGVYDGWVRLFDLEGRLLPTGLELAAEAEQRTAEAEQRTAEAKQQTAEAKQQTAEAVEQTAQALLEAANARRQAAEEGARAERERSRAEALAEQVRALQARLDHGQL